MGNKEMYSVEKQAWKVIIFGTSIWAGLNTHVEWSNLKMGVPFVGSSDNASQSQSQQKIPVQQEGPRFSVKTSEAK